MRTTSLVLCLMLVVGLCIAANAGSISQLPKETSPSYDFSSEFRSFEPLWECAMADDWTCPDGQEIASVRWWGSYWTPPSPGAYTYYSDGFYGAQPGSITSFLISVRTNEGPMGGVPFDHPGDIIAAYTAPISIVNETEAFQITKSTDPLVMERVYEYNVDLGEATGAYGPFPFPQTMGTKYWLCIYARFDNDSANINRQWGWHEADAHSGGYAVQTVEGNFDQWCIPCGGHDMAFELLPVPEPGSICTLAAGLTWLVGLACKRRRHIG